MDNAEVNLQECGGVNLLSKRGVNFLRSPASGLFAKKWENCVVSDK